jgi:hypothetical protein
VSPNLVYSFVVFLEFFGFEITFAKTIIK